VKPETCRAGPITFDLDQARERIEWFIKPGADCLVAAALQRDPDTLQQHLHMATTELRQLIRALEPTAIHALLTIDEPLVRKIGEDPLFDGA
jgi:hypothetical protein